MSLKYSAKIIFDDKKEEPIELIADSNLKIVREKIESLFRSGCVKRTLLNDAMVGAASKKGYRCVLEKYYSLDEIDHIQLIEEFIPDKNGKD